MRFWCRRWTFVATANVVLYNGLKPVFVDVERDFYCVDPAQIERHITPRTRALMPVHIACLPCDMDPIVEICDRRGLRIAEDSAEAMFVNYRGRPVGSFSDVASFSTYVAHMISTGVGGCMRRRTIPNCIVLLKSLMNHGRDSIYTRIDDDAEAQRADGCLRLRIADFRLSALVIAFARRKWKRRWASRNLRSAKRWRCAVSRVAESADPQESERISRHLSSVLPWSRPGTRSTATCSIP